MDLQKDTKGSKATWSALITSRILDGGATMYEYPVKTLIESGQIEEIQMNKRKIGFSPG